MHGHASGGGTLPTDARAGFDAPLVDRAAAIALSLLPGVGPVRWRALMDAHGGDGARAAAAIGASPEGWRVAVRTATTYVMPRTDGLVVLVPGDPEYPRAQLDLPDAPPVLWCLGDASALAHAPRVAIVGTREHSSAGGTITRRLVDALRASGACVVSGMARGIDGIAHDAALAAGLPTVAVVATGVDVAYPPQHRVLHARVAAAGAIVSEHLPGTAARPRAFPRRNRIIAALAECTVVVEAGHRSGALITADVAIDLGRTVAAVPGPMDAPGAAGTNALLRDGAHVIATVDDLVGLVAIGPAAVRPARASREARPRRSVPSASSVPSRVPRPPVDLAPDERQVWDALAEDAADEDTLAARTALPARRCAAALAGLEVRALVATDLSGTVRRL